MILIATKNMRDSEYTHTCSWYQCWIGNLLEIMIMLVGNFTSLLALGYLGFSNVLYIWSVRAIPTCRVYQLNDYGNYFCKWTFFRLFSAPSISIQVSKSTSGSGIAGESFALTCRVLGAENLNPSITHYQWFKNSNGDQIQVGTNSTTLSFATIRLSDAANYSCAVTITSHYLTSSITAVGSQTVTVQSKL